MRALHLALHARLDGAVHVQLFNFDIEHVSDAVEALRRIENFQQLLLFFNRELQVLRDGVTELGRVGHPGDDHRLKIERLAELHVLIKQRVHPLHGRFKRLAGLRRILDGADFGLKIPFSIRELEDFAALHPFDEDLDVAVRQLEVLDDVGNGADLVNFVRLGLVDAGVMLGGEKNLAV